MEPTLAAVAAENRETFTVVKVDVDTAQQNFQRILAYKQSRVIPEYSVFKDGNVVAHFTGSKSKADFLQEILGSINAQMN